VRALIGSDNRYLIPASAITGALVLCLCDLIGRTVIAPHELRTSIVTALIGSPYFLFLIIRMQRRPKTGGLL
jgi:iron complex transport system permease protein